MLQDHHTLAVVGIWIYKMHCSGPSNQGKGCGKQESSLEKLRNYLQAPDLLAQASTNSMHLGKLATYLAAICSSKNYCDFHYTGILAQGTPLLRGKLQKTLFLKR